MPSLLSRTRRRFRSLGRSFRPSFCLPFRPIFSLLLYLSLVCALLFGLSSHTAVAASGNPERITLFDATAVFAPTGTMKVTENITVRAGGDKIKRGIFRTLPLAWKRGDNKRYGLHYEVVGVQRDGKPEPYSLSNTSEAITIRMGSKDVLLEPGLHRYTIEYEISNHFSRFDDWDELYWNVTGNDWDFAIDQARFRLLFQDESGKVLPVTMRSLDIYTGSRGEQGKAARVLRDGGVVTTAPLDRGEGLTVAYTWPRSVLAGAPDPQEKSLLRTMLVPTQKTLFLWIVPAVMACFFCLAYLRLRPKGGMPEVIPLFVPPQGLSAGALRYILKKRYDDQSFAADLLSLIAKGALHFVPDVDGKKNRSLRRDAQQKDRPLRNRSALSAEETQVVEKLFGKSKMVINLGTEDQPEVRAARTYLRKQRDEEKSALFLRIMSLWWAGVAIMLWLPLLVGVLYSSDAGIVPMLALLFCGLLTGVPIFVVVLLLRSVRGFFSFVFKLPFILGALLFLALPALFAYEVALPVCMALGLPDGYLGALACSALLCLIFYLVAPRRTAAGLERLAQAKGLIMYLGTAERQRFEALYPPEDSVQRFEELLPYALALDVGKTWANRFAGYLAETGLEAEQFQGVGWSDVQHFRSLSAGASTSRAVSSGGWSSGSGGGGGSGSSGGGSSGGGSGGGGGGGW